MSKFVTIGYGDRAGYERLSEDARASAHGEDAKLQAAPCAVAYGVVEVWPLEIPT